MHVITNGTNIVTNGTNILTVGDSPYLLPNLRFVHDVGRQTPQADGSEFVTLTDWTGNGYSAQQNTATNRPWYYNNSQNGRPSIRFDGLDNFMSVGLLNLLTNKAGATYGCIYKKTDTSTTTQQTIFHVHRNNSSFTTGRIEIIPSRTTTKNASAFGLRADNDASNMNAEDIGVDDTNVHFMVGIYNYTAGTVSLYIDGVLRITQTLASSGNTDNTNAANIRYGVRGAPTQVNWFKGDFFEDFFCDTALSIEYLDGLWAYYRNRYAL